MTRTTKTERMARDRLMRNLIYLSQETWIPNSVAQELPAAWHTILHDEEVGEKKEKVTLYLDRSVARFYREMGTGYQTRINRVLATFAQMHLAKEVRLDEVLRKEMGVDDTVKTEGEE